MAKLWHAPLKKLLARKGFEVVGEFSCRGFDTWGPLWLTGGLNWRHPSERDLARAREFAGRVVGRDSEFDARHADLMEGERVLNEPIYDCQR